MDVTKLVISSKSLAKTYSLVLRSVPIWPGLVCLGCEEGAVLQDMCWGLVRLWPGLVSRGCEEGTVPQNVFSGLLRQCASTHCSSGAVFTGRPGDHRDPVTSAQTLDGGGLLPVPIPDGLSLRATTDSSPVVPSLVFQDCLGFLVGRCQLRLLEVTAYLGFFPGMPQRAGIYCRMIGRLLVSTAG